MVAEILIFFSLSEPKNMLGGVILILLWLVSLVSSASSGQVEQCRQLFTSDKDYMKQLYMKENKQLDASAVYCDSWGCHNYSGCCYNGNCNGEYWGWGWGVGFAVLFGFCLFIILIAALIGSFVWPNAGYSPYNVYSGYGDPYYQPPRPVVIVNDTSNNKSK